MINLNKVLLAGVVEYEFEVKPVAGSHVANIVVATIEEFIGKDGTLKQLTHRHNVVLWGKLAEKAGQSLKKGSEVLVEGKLTTRTYDNKDGQKVKLTEIKADALEIPVTLGVIASNDIPPTKATRSKPHDDINF